MADYLKLLLIRHGESQGNVDGCLEGQTSTPLSAKGQWQAQQLAVYLQTQPPPSQLYSSPLQRAVQTARYLENMTGCRLRLDANLQELDQGIFQGLTWHEACQRYPQTCAELMATLDYRPVPGAESLMAAHQRAVTWHETLWQHHAPGEVVWLVSHGGFLQQLIGVLMGCDRTWQIPIRHTALFEFWLLSPTMHQSNQHNPECWKLIRFNDTPHLESSS